MPLPPVKHALITLTCGGIAMKALKRLAADIRREMGPTRDLLVQLILLSLILSARDFFVSVLRALSGVCMG